MPSGLDILVREKKILGLATLLCYDSRQMLTTQYRQKNDIINNMLPHTPCFQQTLKEGANKEISCFLHWMKKLFSNTCCLYRCE